MQINAIIFPENLTHLNLRLNSDQMIDKNTFPTKLTHLIFYGEFNKMVGKNVLPKGLKEVTFHKHYSRSRSEWKCIWVLKHNYPNLLITSK